MFCKSLLVFCDRDAGSECPVGAAGALIGSGADAEFGLVGIELDQH